MKTKSIAEPVMVTITTSEIDHVATGAKMSFLRRAAGMTMREMARRIGVSAGYLCDLEHGRRHWGKERLKGYATELLRPVPKRRRVCVGKKLVGEKQYGDDPRCRCVVKGDDV